MTVLRGPMAAIVAACAASAAPAAAATVVVTPTTLVAAFNAARSGDTLKLVGTFAGARLGNGSFTQMVTLDLSAATFTNMLQLTNTNNVRISGGHFNLGGDSAWTKGILFVGGRNLYADRVTVTGSGSQWGVSVVDTANAQITNGSFSHLNAAVLFGSVAGGTAIHNTITAAESDGIDIANSHMITASYNSCSAGAPGPGVHPDCIQLWSVTGDPLQSDITVTTNSATGPTQGFTSFSYGGGGLRLKLLGNTVNTSYSQGVACYDCINSVIANNRVSTLPGSMYQTVINVVGGSGNMEYGNTVAPYRPAQPNVALLADDGLLPDPSDAVSTHDMFTSLILANPSPAATVPEPATWALLIAGFAAVGLARRTAEPRATGRGDRRMA